MFRKNLLKFHAILPYIVGTATVAIFLWKGGKAIDATWALGALAILCAIDAMYVHNTRPKLPNATIISTVLFAVITIISFMYSQVANYGFDEVIHTVSVLYIFWWAYIRVSLAKNVEWQVTTAAIVYYTNLLAVIVGMFVYTLQPVNRFVGTFFDYRFHTDYWPNAWAQVLLLLLPISVWFTWQACKRVHSLSSWLYIFGLSFQFSALFLSYSRGATIALIGGIILWVCILIIARIRLQYTRVFLRTLVATVCTLLFFVIANSVREQRFPVQSVQEKLTFTASEGKISINERAQFWQQSLELIPKQPIFGYGPYAFRFVQPHLQQHVLATSDHPHNVLLKYALERGVIAATAFTCFLLSIAYYVVRKLWHNRKQNSDIGFFLALCVGVSAVFAHNLIDYNLQFIGITLPLYLALSAILAISQLHKIPTTASYRFIHLPALIVLAFLLLSEGRALVYGSIGRHALADGNQEKALPYLKVAKHAWFTRDTHMSIMDTYINQQKPQEALEIFAEYQTINIHDARAWKLRGDACRQLNDLDCALQSYETAWNLSKYNDISPIRWYIETLVDSGKNDEITKNLSQYDGIINDYQLAIRNGVHHIGLSQNVEELLGLLDRLQLLYPERNQEYSSLSKDIEEKAKKDRDFVAARQPGLLW